MLRHVIGVLGHQPISTSKFQIEHELSQKWNDHTKSYVFKMIPGPQLLRGGHGIQDYYSELSSLGKHYLISTELKNKQVKNGYTVLRRHYTIANCLKIEFYKELSRCLQINLGKEAIENMRISLQSSTTS